MSLVYLVLHNIRSVHNVGSIFRTADAAGVAKIYLTGYTPAPVDRFGRVRKDFAKVSLGAEQTVFWESVQNISSLLSRLKKEKAFLVAVEQSPYSIHYKKVPRKQNTALLFGNEVHGLSPAILKKCDCVAEIPMRGTFARNRSPNDGGKESLNIAVAAGIALFSVATA